VAQGICNSASPPVQLPSLASLLNSTNSSTSASASSSSSAAAATSHSSASGRVDGDMRIEMALAAMIGVVFIAFFAV